MATKDQLIASAQKNLEKGQIKKAIKDYQELLKLEPKVDQHKQKLADLLCRIDLKVEALDIYDSLAKGYAERGFFAKGVAVYKQMQRIDPTRLDVYLRLAELNRSLGLSANAMSEYRSVLDLYEKRNMVANAVGVLQKMVELEPENINLQLRVLQNYIKEKLYSKATETTLKACEVCAKSGDTAKSQKILQSILSHLPNNKEFHTDLANKLTGGGLFTDAIYLFQALLEGTPHDPLILNELATLYGKIDDAKNELLFLDQLLAVQPTGEVAERFVRHCLVAGDYARSQRILAEHEALLGDEKHTELYRELEGHLSGNQRVPSAVGRISGDGPAIPALVAAPLSQPVDLILSEMAEDSILGDEEFGLDDLLSLRPRSPEATPLPPPVEEIVEEETAEVSIDLPLGEVSFDDIDTFAGDLDDVALEIADKGAAVEDLDTNDEIAAPTLAEGVRQDEVASSAINIDFDFSQFEEEEAETNGEIEVEFGGALEIDLAGAEDVEQIETAPTYELDRNAGLPGLDLSPLEEPLPIYGIQDDVALPVSAIDYDFAEEAADETAARLEGKSDDDVMGDLDVDLLGEVEDEEEILELEPLDEEDEEDDLSTELAALEDLLAVETEESSLEQRFELNVAVEQAESAASPVVDDFLDLPASHVDDDFFDLAAEILDEGALQATEGLANVAEIDRFRFDSVFSEFKKGVDAQIDHDDTEAHYDLGIAYKEMGLMDDAIEEFKKSMRSLKRLADSLILIGICYAEKGAFADAEVVFSTAIARPEVQEVDKIGTQYELGLVYEVWGRPVDALRTFEAVAYSDPSFRNVGEKIEALQLLVAAGEGDAVKATPGSASPGKDRVSFV